MRSSVSAFKCNSIKCTRLSVTRLSVTRLSEWIPTACRNWSASMPQYLQIKQVQKNNHLYLYGAVHKRRSRRGGQVNMDKTDGGGGLSQFGRPQVRNYF